MKKCECWHKGHPVFHGASGQCYGTRECDPCDCGGDESKCDFYPEKRKAAMKPEFGKWISVKERLPVKQFRVIVRTGHNLVTTGWRSYNVDARGGELWEVDGAHNYHNDVTHWMPLPEPPKED